MKFNFKIILILSFIAGFFISCDDKIRELEELNTAPDFQYLKRGAINWEVAQKDAVITDSAKIWTQSNNATYPALVRIVDRNFNIDLVSVKSTNSEVSFFVDNNTYYNLFETREKKEEFNLAFKNNKKSIEEFTVTAKDDFGASNKITFKIEFKENKPPKPVFKLILINGSNKTYQLFGEESYDIDKAIGGDIVEYEFVIDNIIIKTSQPNIYHIFKTGTHDIKFRVRDNDDVWSEYITTSLKVL